MESSAPYVVLHGDDEIPEVRAVLEELGIDYQIIAKTEPLILPSHLLISSGSLAVEALQQIGRKGRNHHFLHVVVIDRASRSLKTMLERQGCDMIARRPLHPTVLRLIVQRALYQGSEKRELHRVAIGATVKFKQSSGLVTRNATLSEISLRGCGLITQKPLTVGADLKIILPGSISGGAALTLSGRVAGAVSRLVVEEGQASAAIVFTGMNGNLRKKIGNIMAAHGMGPTGMLALAPGTPIREDREGTGVVAALQKAAVVRSPPPQQPDAEQAQSSGLPTSSAPSSPESAQGAERRTTQRGAYPQSVVGRTSSATHSLIGRDLSVGGMRVSPEAGLEVGMQLRLAVYGTAGVRPVIVSADVVRDDGDEGLGLSFAPLPQAAKRRLQQIVDGLDELTIDSDSTGILISEVLTTE